MLRGKRLKFWRWAPAEQRYFLSSPAWDMVANERWMGEAVKFFAGVSYVTILREPIDRLFSAWQFGLDKPSREEPLESRGQRFAQFLQGDGGLGWRRNYLLSKLLWPEHTGDGNRLELGMRRLDQFDHVFLTENLASDIAAMSREGWSHLELPWRNAGAPGNAGWSAAREALKDHPDLLAGLIRENQDDVELYAYAQSLAERRKANEVRPAREPAGEREMPPGSNLDFLVCCAYEAHLMKDEARCLELLGQAESHFRAKRIDIGSARNLTEFALLRFRQPRRVLQQHVRQTEAKQSAKRAPTELE
jgi:hypothetical protein